MRMKVEQSRACPDKRILSDETVVPELEKSAKLYPKPLRRIVARVEVDGREMEMTFLTNNFGNRSRVQGSGFRVIQTLSRAVLVP